MNTKEIEKAFQKFEEKYELPPVFKMSNGDIIGAFIITRDGESFMISADSSEDDVREAAKMVGADRQDEAVRDITALKAYCTSPQLQVPSSATLQ